MHGKGKYTWKDGRYYEGDYFNDKKVNILEKIICSMVKEYIGGLTVKFMKGDGMRVSR